MTETSSLMSLLSSRWSLWVLIIATGLITYFMRASFLVFANPERFPQWFRTALSFVPATALTALVVPGLVFVGNSTTFDWKNPRLYAGAVAFLLALKLKQTIWSLALGMAALWLLLWLKA
jgi:branched-subunit amino acid transport protein